jgi:hypothetical protein
MVNKCKKCCGLGRIYFGDETMSGQETVLCDCQKPKEGNNAEGNEGGKTLPEVESAG